MQTKQNSDKDIKLDRPPKIPAQGFGPHFAIDDNGVITFAPIEAIDGHGNNVARLERIHPTLRALATKLDAEIGAGNIPHWHLAERVAAYASTIDNELGLVDFTRLYVEGVRLANAEKTAIDKIAQGDLPALDTHLREALDSLLQLHGAFILSTADGIELIGQEERYRRTRQEEEEYRNAAVDFAKTLQNQPKVISPDVAAFILGASQEIGAGPNPERSSVAASGTLKNVAVTFSTAAALAALSVGAIASGSPSVIIGAGAAALILGEGLKRSKPFATVAALITKALDQTSAAEIDIALRSIIEYLRPQLEMVLANEPILRRLSAQYSGLDWLIRSLEWIKQHKK